MSNFQREITKQILSAPPCSMRSIRYSLTARGRSAPPSKRLPTGSNSFEKASGWMRVPLPAAGMIPHMPSTLHTFGFRPRRHGGAGLFQECGQFCRTFFGGMLVEHALSAGFANLGELAVAEVERGQDVVGSPHDHDIAPRIEELVEPVPPVAQHRHTARRRLEQPPGRAPAVIGHRL